MKYEGKQYVPQDNSYSKILSTERGLVSEENTYDSLVIRQVNTQREFNYF